MIKKVLGVIIFTVFGGAALALGIYGLLLKVEPSNSPLHGKVMDLVFNSANKKYIVDNMNDQYKGIATLAVVGSIIGIAFGGISVIAGITSLFTKVGWIKFIIFGVIAVIAIGLAVYGFASAANVVKTDFINARIK